MTDARALDALLDRMQYEADPVADEAIDAIVGAWPAADGLSAEGWIAANRERWERLDAANAVFAHWTRNDIVLSPERAIPADTPAVVADAMRRYLARTRAELPLPDADAIAAAENLFMDHGVVACLLLFCASLPQCYVVPDLSLTLHIAGQLEDRTDHRIRATAAMVFPVMAPGGLTSPEGSGLAQVLKVRLIHAMIRNLILRGTPQAAAEASRAGANADVAALPRPPGRPAMHQAMAAHGWNVARDGLPCNQEELAYTLLTFHYVFLAGLRRLRIRLAPGDETAYLRAWNSVGRLVGVNPELMAGTLDEAGALFAAMQARGRAQPLSPDPRPPLAAALMRTLEDVIAWGPAKPLPRLMTRHLCGEATARDLGLSGSAPWVSRLLFSLLLGVTRAVDGLMWVLRQDFRITRYLWQTLGQRFMVNLLLSQTRPLELPSQVRTQIGALSTEAHAAPAPRWARRLRHRLVPHPLRPTVER